MAQSNYIKRCCHWMRMGSNCQDGKIWLRRPMFHTVLHCKLLIHILCYTTWILFRQQIINSLVLMFWVFQHNKPCDGTKNGRFCFFFYIEYFLLIYNQPCYVTLVVTICRRVWQQKVRISYCTNLLRNSLWSSQNHTVSSAPW